MIYPKKKDDAKRRPYHLTAKEPIRNISGLTSQGTIWKSISRNYYIGIKGRKFILVPGSAFQVPCQIKTLNLKQGTWNKVIYLVFSLKNMVCL